MNTQTYLHNQAQAQFSDEKREEIEEAQLGKNNFSDESYVKKLAEIKDKSARQCEFCEKWIIIDNLKNKPYLCPRCTEGKSVISGYLKSHKQEHLNQQDKQRIGESRTLRRGPFFKPTT